MIGIKEITVSFAYTQNMGNYESRKIMFSATAELNPNEDSKKEFDNLFDYLEGLVMDKIVDKD